MKKLILAFCLITTILVMVITACAPSATPTAPSATQPGTTSPPAKVIELIYNDTTPAQVPKCQHAQAWAKKIEEMSGGRVKFTFYWSNSLIPQPEIMKGVSQGVADVSYFPFSVDFVPLNYEIMYMPFMGYTSMEMGTKVWNELYAKFPALQDEFKKAGVKLLNANLMPPQQFHLAKKSVRLPADLKGVKMYSTGSQADLVAAAGGVPVQIGSITEMYTALERGMIDGVVNHYPVMMVFGCMPLVPYHTNFGKGGISMGLHGLIMNPKKYDSLPADIRKIIDDLNPWYVEEMLKIDNSEIERAVNAGREMKHTYTDLTPEEIAAWAKLAKPLHEDWIKKMEAKGYPAREIYNEALKLIEKYK